MGAMAFAVYMALTAVAWAIDRGPRERAAA